MIPVCSVEEMRAIDADADDSEDVLIKRAGWAVARTARRMLGGTYGRRIVVVAGSGNNGADGKYAADVLSRWGARVEIVDLSVSDIANCDLVIDAAFGTGFRGEYKAPNTNGIPILAVDIPSGVNGNTGEADPGAVQAAVTVTFAALKPGLLFGRGAELAGLVELADIGLDTRRSRVHVVEAADVFASLPQRRRESHKWRQALEIVAGSPGMMGAAHLSAHGAMRAGAGMVHLRTPGLEPENFPANEIVTVQLSPKDWADEVLSDLDRMGALVIGPGLGRDSSVAAEIRSVIESTDLPIVADSDALFALGEDAPRLLKSRNATTVLTPHDGEYRFLTGQSPTANRIDAARQLASATNSVVLLKGSTTVVSSPSGDTLVVLAGDSRLATAGTGDVLSGIIGAFLTRGLDGLQAAAYGAFVHGVASRMTGKSEGMTAGDLPEAVSLYLASRTVGA